MVQQHRSASTGGRLAAAFLASCLALAGAGCSDDGGESATSTTPSTTTPEPTTTTEPVVEDPVVTVIAHRGASADAPELTFAAFDLAIEQGAHFIEIDVQFTADRELVLLHDDDLDRTARGPAESCTGPVAERTLAEMGECDFGVWFNEEHPEVADPDFADQPIPTVASLVERYGTDVGYLIEIKSPEDQPGIEEALLEVLDAAGLTGPGGTGEGNVVVQSFDSESMKRMHDLRPELPVAQLASVSDPVTEEALDEVSTYATTFAPLFGLVDQALVDAARERCLRITPWTIDDPVEMERLLDLGVDGLITNVPDTALATTVGREPPPLPDHCGAGTGSKA